MKVFLSGILLLLCLNTSFASLKISTYNIRNFGRSGTFTDTHELKKIIENTQADLIGIQEIVNVNKFKKFVSKSLPTYQVIFSKCGGRGNQKLGFIYNPSKLKLVNITESDELSDVAISKMDEMGCRGSLRPVLIGHFQEIKTKKKYVAMVVHLKAGGATQSIRRRAIQYEILKNIIKRFDRKGIKNIVAMGDFNTTGYTPRNEDYDNFNELVTSLEFFDSAKKIDCTSYWGGNVWDDNIEEPSILDHILVSKSLYNIKNLEVSVGAHCKKVTCSEASRNELGNSYKRVSDHCPVNITVN